MASRDDTWEHGRELASMSSSGTTWNFTYDANGMRTQRTDGTTTYSYVYNGGQLSRMTISPAIGATTENTLTLDFTYDASGTPLSVVYNGTYYYYVTDLQGDVVAIVNTQGEKVVEYLYDAWGRMLTTGGTKAADLGLHNPLRYRGYVYDPESGLYYLQSRYYNPTLGRFINADVFTSTGQGLTGNNMFAYCGNNPVNRIDPTGLCWAEFWDGFKQIARDILHGINNAIVESGIDTAAAGAPLLNMYESSPGIYHAESDCWQQYAGYNSIYDFFFDIGTSMSTDQFAFTYDGVDYLIWVWKGDYINLGAGAELGIYYGGGPHWFVDTSLAMPMSLSLALNGNSIISHQQTTWWITGFNSNYLNVQAKDLTAIYTIYFNSPGMYNAFAYIWNGNGGWTCNPNNLSAILVF